MNIQYLLLQQTVIMFLLIGMGYGLFKGKFVTAASSKEFSVLLIYISFPSVVIDAFLSAGREGMGDLALSFILAFIGLLTAAIVSYMCFGKRYPIENFSTTFGNAGFMGLPLVLAVFGEEGVLYVTGVVVLLTLGQWTYGVVLMTGSSQAIKLRRLTKNPVILATIIGLILVYMPFQLPDVVTQPLVFAKNMNTPLAMIVVGISLAQTNVFGCLKKPTMYAVALVRLIIVPLVTLVVFKLTPFMTDEMLLPLMVVLSTPVGSNVAIAAEMYNMDSQKAVQQVCFTTLLSIITIPIIMGIVEYFI